MKVKFLPVCLCLGAATLFCLNSCNRDDSDLNQEANVLSFSLGNEDSMLVTAPTMPSDGSTTITLQFKDTTNLSKYGFLPKMTLSDGATVYPYMRPFHFEKLSHNGEYLYAFTVTSQDKSLKKDYIIQAINYTGSLSCNFDKWTNDPKATNKIPKLDDPFWDSANEGLAILHSSDPSYLYPCRSTTDAYNGNKFAALLETQQGGDSPSPFSPMIISGVLFKGNFDMNKLDFDHPQVCTQMGEIITQQLGKPDELTGHYKYVPGKGDFIDGNTGAHIAGKVDSCAIYAVMYSVPKGPEGAKVSLDGTNILSDKSIIAKAIVATEHPTSGKGYVPFSAKFVYTQEPDYVQNNYKLAIVFASSAEGAFFRGTPGSQLFVGDVDVKTTPYQN